MSGPAIGKPVAPATIVATAAVPSLLAKVEELIAKVEATYATDKSKVESYLSKYWPIAAGIVIALTRLL